MFAPIITALYFWISCLNIVPWKYSWLIFFAIPIFYIGVSPFHKLLNRQISVSKAFFDYIDGALPVGITFFFLATGLLIGGWKYLWTIFFLVPLYYTTKEAVIKRNLSIFCYPVLVAWVYVALGFIMNNWIIGIPIFATIPFFYIVSEHFRKKHADKH